MKILVEEQKPIELPCRTYTGHCLDQFEADALNSYLPEINKLAGKIVDTNSMQWNEREFFLNQRHSLFLSIVGQSN